MSAVDDLVQPDLRATGMGQVGAISPDEVKQFAKALFGLIENLTTKFHRFINQDDWIAFHFTIEATSCHTGKPVSLDCQTMARIVDGKIQTGINHADWISFFEQLGQLPPKVLSDCMAGRSHAMP